MADYSPNGYAYEVHFASWSPESGFTRVAPQEHAPQTRPLSASPLFSARYGYGWPRDFTLPHVEDEDD